MGMRLKDLPNNEKPREVALRDGIESLNDESLLALVLNSGVKGRDVLELSSSILSIYKNYTNLANESHAGLKEIKGLSEAKVLRLLAVFEIAKRLEKEKFKEVEIYKDQAVIYDKYHSIFSSEHETLILLLMDYKYHLIKEKKYIGLSGQKITIDPKELIYELLISKAKKFVLIHTHLTDDVKPSDDDILATNALTKMANNLNIDLYDHLIIGKSNYYSFLNGYSKSFKGDL